MGGILISIFIPLIVISAGNKGKNSSLPNRSMKISPYIVLDV